MDDLTVKQKLRASG